MRALILMLALAGCGSLQAHQARTRLIGLPADDLIACAGIADHEATLSDGDRVASYSFSSDKALLSISALEYLDLSIGAVGGCHALFRIRDGRVIAVHYEGTQTTLSGPLAACAPIIRDCLGAH